MLHWNLVYIKTVDSVEGTLCLATQSPNILWQHILKQWIALNSRAHWLVKLRISCAIHLRAIRVRFALENRVIVAGINELKSSYCAILSHCFSKF